MIKAKIEQLDDYIKSLSTQTECIDAVLAFCETHNIEVEQAAAYIVRHPTLLARVQAEAARNRSIKVSPGLPV